MRTSRRRTSRGPRRQRRVSRNAVYTLPTHRTDKSKWFVQITAVPGAKGAFDGGAFFDTRKNAEWYIADQESDYWKRGKYTYELKTVAQLDEGRRADVLARAKAGWRVDGFERSFVGHEGDLKRARALAARRPVRNTSKKAPKLNELTVWDSVGTVRSAKPREMREMFPPGVAAKFRKLPPGLYKYGVGPKRGESIVRFKNASLKGAMTSTRIGASKVHEYHWLVDNFDPSFPVIIRGIDDRGKSYFRVEEYAKSLVREPALVRRSSKSKKTSR